MFNKRKGSSSNRAKRKDIAHPRPRIVSREAVPIQPRLTALPVRDWKKAAAGDRDDFDDAA